MALATVTGFLNTVNDGIDELVGVELYFVPSGNAVSQSQETLFLTEPAKATITSTVTGAFTVQLQEQSGLTGVPNGDFYYYPRVVWLNGSKQLDFIQWKVRVPDGGGFLADFIEAPPPANAIVLGQGEPPASLEDVLYMDLIDGQIYLPEGSF